MIANAVAHRFFYSIRWGAIESIFYQLLFIGHHAALFNWCAPATYGTVGILFSALYISVTLCNLGLDLLLAPHIKSWSLAQRNVTDFLSLHLPATLIAVALVAAVTGILWSHSHGALWIIMISLLCIESFRKTMRTALRLVNYNRSIALIEISTFLLYMALTWGSYSILGSFTLISIFLPLVITGFMSSLVLLLCAKQWYATLPTTSFDSTQLPLLGARIPLITHQVTGTLLSPNILVLLCSLRLDIAQVGSVKFMSTVIHGLALILNKTFGTATAVLYATEQLLSTKNSSSTQLLRSSFSLPFTILLYGTILGSLYAYASGSASSINIFLTLAISLSTCYVATYEQVFISNLATNSMLVPNAATLIAMIILSQLPFGFSASVLMGVFLALRIATAIVLSYTASKKWHVRPLLEFKSFFIAGSLAAVALIILMKR